MSGLLSLLNASKAFGVRRLFESVSLSVGSAERVGLVGANGSGKSTLLKIMAGLESPDSGELVLRKGVRVAYVAQREDFGADATVFDVVARPLRPLGLPEVDLIGRVSQALSRTGFTDHLERPDGLSGGWRKRLALARALAMEPDLLLLDEPTNHLDVESILWLEKLLAPSEKGGLQKTACVVVSHDRYFLENVCSRTVELGHIYPGGLLDVAGNYTALLERRADFLASQSALEQALASKARREIEWLSRQPKARGTKAKGRIDEAGRIMRDLAETKSRTADAARAGVEFSGTARQTKRLLVAENITKRLGGRTLFQGLDVVLSPGVRLGLVGANGSGKSTLLRTLCGELAPDQGRVKTAPELRTAIFTQGREELDQSLTLRKALAEYGDSVIFQDRPIHVAGWAKRFLFRPEQLDLPVSALSGGEQARALIARLTLAPADVLFLDEPTNDLDIPTLEVLEESLMDFPGAVVLISHDRSLLDRVCTTVIGLDGRGGAEFFADSGQWVNWLLTPASDGRQSAKPETSKAARSPEVATGKKRLSYMEQREWDGMEAAIGAAETVLAGLDDRLADPEVVSDAYALQDLLTRQAAAKAEVDRLYARWAELEEKQGPNPDGS